MPFKPLWTSPSWSVAAVKNDDGKYSAWIVVCSPVLEICMMDGLDMTEHLEERIDEILDGDVDVMLTRSFGSQSSEHEMCAFPTTLRRIFQASHI